MCSFFVHLSIVRVPFVAQSNLSSISLKSSQSMTRPRPGSFGNTASSSYGSTKSFPTSSSSGSIAPPPSMQRNPNRTQSKSNETDLISFTISTDNISNDTLLLSNDAASNVSTASPINDSHSNFKQMVDEIHR